MMLMYDLLLRECRHWCYTFAKIVPRKLAGHVRSISSIYLVPNSVHFVTTINKIAIQATAQMAAEKEPLAYRESTCTNLSVSCPHYIIVYSVLKHIDTTRMHSISWQCIPLIYGPLWKNEYVPKSNLLCPLFRVIYEIFQGTFLDLHIARNHTNLNIYLFNLLHSKS